MVQDISLLIALFLSRPTFHLIVIGWTVLAVVLFPLLLKVRAPYGRHTSSGWGPMVDNRVGWIVMEFPTLLLFSLLTLLGPNDKSPAVWVFFSFWVIHYTNRIFVFPLLIHTKGKKMPLLVVFLAMIFNLVNGFINGYWLGYISPGYSIAWIADPRFLVGVGFFVIGFLINQSSDHKLIRLRSGGKTGYFIPRGGLFNLISCPNFFGEILEWTGFAIMTWSLPGLSFAVWTAANLIPRALHHHAWYQSTFSDYPQKRKAVIPGLL